MRNRPTPSAPTSFALFRVLRQLDIGVERDIFAVQRARPAGYQALELGALEFQLGLPEPVLGQHTFVGIDNQHAARAVDDQQVFILDQRAGMLHADHRRDRQAARDDGGMRSTAAHVGDEAANFQGLELDGVGRRKIVGDDDQVIVGAGRFALRQLALLAL